MLSVTATSLDRLGDHASPRSLHPGLKEDKKGTFVPLAFGYLTVETMVCKAPESIFHSHVFDCVCVAFPGEAST